MPKQSGKTSSFPFFSQSRSIGVDLSYVQEKVVLPVDKLLEKISKLRSFRETPEVVDAEESLRAVREVAKSVINSGLSHEKVVTPASSATAVSASSATRDSASEDNVTNRPKF